MPFCRWSFLVSANLFFILIFGYVPAVINCKNKCTFTSLFHLGIHWRRWLTKIGSGSKTAIDRTRGFFPTTNYRDPNGSHLAIVAVLSIKPQPTPPPTIRFPVVNFFFILCNDRDLLFLLVAMNGTRMYILYTK